MSKKRYIGLLIIAIIVFIYPVSMQAEEETINIAVSTFQEFDKIVLYYQPLNMETYASIKKEDLKKQYFYRIEIQKLALAFSDLKTYVTDVLDSREFKPEKKTLDYRAIIEFWRKDRIVYEYALGYEPSSMEINGTVVKRKKEYFRLVQKLLPPSEGNEIFWVEPSNE